MAITQSILYVFAMLTENRSTFRPEDVILLLTDITGMLIPKPAEEREILIQRGVHYSEMLPLEYSPSERYILEYYRALDGFALETAKAVMTVTEKIYLEKRESIVLVSLARAGTPIGILIKRYLRHKYGIDAPHYTISIVRDRGIDDAAIKYILQKHSATHMQFVDGWTGKGAILDELYTAMIPYIGKLNKRLLLAVLADPANITDICGTHDDIPIASSFLNSTVCGLMSRTVIIPGIHGINKTSDNTLNNTFNNTLNGTFDNTFHGVAFFEEFRAQDRTYEFIERIENCINDIDIPGFEEVWKIAKQFGISDINLIKPGIGESTRVLLRRIPDMLLIAENVELKYVAHLIQLAEEKHIPVKRYPLMRYKACGIIKALTPDL